MTVPVDVDLATNAVDENATAGTAVGLTVLASDADATTNGVTFTLTGNPGGLFEINPTTGEVTVAAAIDRELIGGSADIEVTATSADGSTAVEVFTIAIGDVDESDVTVPVDVDLAANAVDENAAVGTAVGVTALASDADATANGVTYALTGNPGGLFQINPTTGEVTVAARDRSRGDRRAASTSRSPRPRPMARRQFRPSPYKSTMRTTRHRCSLRLPAQP